MSMGIFTIDLAANESREVAVSGEYFEIRNALFPITLVELLDRSGGVIARLDNPEQSDFVRPGTYENIRITNGATAQKVKHFYGSGDAGSRRTSGLVRIDGASDVSIIDGAKNLTLLGKAFWASGLTTAVVAQFPIVQFFNPVGSGKNLVVTSILLASSTSGVTVVGISSASIGVVSGLVRSKKSPGNVSATTQSRILNSATVSPTFLELFVPYVQALQSINISFKEPIIIEPGFAIEAYAAAVNVDLRFAAQFVEETI